MKKGSARCSHNDFIYQAIHAMRVKADLINNKNAVFSYCKMMRSLERYPLPIISAQQVVNLDGFGFKGANLVFKQMLKHYNKYEKEAPVQWQPVEPPTKPTEDRPEKASSQPENAPAEEGGKTKELTIPIASTFVNVKKPTKKGKKQANFPPILINLFHKQTESGYRKYFSRDEIIARAELAEGDKVSKIHFSEGNFQKLIQENLIEHLDFDIDSRFKLTEEGFKAAQLHLESLKVERRASDAGSMVVEGRVKVRPVTTREEEQEQSGLPELLTKKRGSMGGDRDYRIIKPALETSVSNFRTHQNLPSAIESVKLREREARTEVSDFAHPLVHKLSGKTGAGRPKNKAKAQPVEDIKGPHTLAASLVAGFRVILYVDLREISCPEDKEYFTAKMSAANVTFMLKNLYLGDFTWVVEVTFRSGQTEIFQSDVIVERKTVPDLTNSIIDGRYRSQKARLAKCGLRNIYYLIEGNTAKLENVQAREAIDAMVAKSDFKLIFCETGRETKNFLVQIHKILTRRIRKSLDEGAMVFPETYRMFSKLQKSVGSISHQQLTINMFAKIPTISLTTAIKLTQQFPSLVSLYQAVTEGNDQAALTEVLNVRQLKAVRDFMTAYPTLVGGKTVCVTK